MKDILINFDSPSLGNNAIFGEDLNNMNEPWRLLKERLFELGYNLKTADQNPLDNAALVIFMDGNSLGRKIDYPITDIMSLLKQLLKPKKDGRDLYEECINQGLKDKLILVMWEGKSVKPFNYYKKLHDKFSTILTWNDDLVDNKKFLKFILPIPSGVHDYPVLPFNQKKLLTNISYNKYSSYKHELYSARRESIEYFDKNYPNDFDLYGPRWNKPITRLQTLFPKIVKIFSTYRGHTKDKITTLSKYKFNISYENISDARGLVTEKIFDSLKAGTVPIYLGAPNVEEYVDKDVFIDRRKFKNNEELAKYITEIKEDEYNRYIVAGKRYMNSEKYKKFMPENFSNTIIKHLGLK